MLQARDKLGQLPGRSLAPARTPMDTCPWLFRWDTCPGCHKCPSREGRNCTRGFMVLPEDAYLYRLSLTTELDYFGPREALKAALRFAVRKDILILIPMFVYMGVELTFWVSVYGTALGYTERFGELRESLVGLHGVFVGVGQIVGGVAFGLLGGCAQKHGKWQALVFGTAVNLVTFLLAFLNLPSPAPLGMTKNDAFIVPNPYVAMLCSTLLGLADAAWNNQLFAYFGTIYPDNCISAFAVFQFWQSVGNASAFGYSTVLQLPYQLLIMAVNALLAVVGFFIVDTKSGRITPKKS